MTHATTEKPEIKVLGDLILVQLDIRGSDLEAKLDRETDLKGVKMPPKSVVSAGVKRFADPQLKRPFDRIAKQAERICREAGIPVLSGWAVPPERANTIHTELKALRDEYLLEADKLAGDWDKHITDWETRGEHVEMIDMLRRRRPDAANIRARYRFSHTMFRIQGAVDDVNDPINEGVVRQEGAIVDILLEDLSANATRLLKKSFEGKDQVKRRVIQPVAGLADKLRSFSMVDPLVYPIAESIAGVIASLPASGILSRTETAAIRGLLEMLTSPQKVREHGYAVLTRSDAAEDADDADAEITLEGSGSEEQADEAAAMAVESVSDVPSVTAPVETPSPAAQESTPAPKAKPRTNPAAKPVSPAPKPAQPVPQFEAHALVL
ncbi:MAG: hypothetical protein BGP25_05030 [Lysobacterales bacterium 63-13]|nr:MAG: hypothetical protein BGP25_05030 [Xanthomonadales bacterium 63-13]